MLSVAVRALGEQVFAHPKLVGGSTAFLIVFGFVSANALWYQPGHHPAPFLRTRDENDPNGIAGYRMTSTLGEHGNVTTFRIERPTDVLDMDAQQPSAQSGAGQGATVGQGQQPASHPSSELVEEIQRELARRGLYDGPADGLTGPRTTAAILFFEEMVGMEQTGEPTSRVLSALKIDSATTVAAIPKAVPKDRPTAANGGGVALDPVAAAIRNAEANPLNPQNVSLSSANSGKPAGKDIVSKIQQGLVNIAYADVKVDGVAGEQTRQAIRNFEKHYRLPETGEPSEAVLKKLKSIGAL